MPKNITLSACWWGHPDCFGHRAYPDKCSVIYQTYFPGRHDCPFYKSQESYEEEKKKYGGAEHY